MKQIKGFISNLKVQGNTAVIDFAGKFTQSERNSEYRLRLFDIRPLLANHGLECSTILSDEGTFEKGYVAALIFPKIGELYFKKEGFEEFVHTFHDIVEVFPATTKKAKQHAKDKFDSAKKVLENRNVVITISSPRGERNGNNLKDILIGVEIGIIVPELKSG